MNASRFIKWVNPAIKILLQLLVIWFVGKALYNSIDQIDWSILTIKPLQSIFGALILFSSNIFGAWIQRTFYRKFDFVLSWPQGFSLYTVPQIAKYLPGKFWTVIGYSGLAKSFIIPVIVSGSGVLCLRDGD
jgi:hypothetical protein